VTRHKSALQNFTHFRNYLYNQTVGTLRALANLVPLQYHQVDIMKEIQRAGNISRMMDKKIHVGFEGENLK
jgi:hypothetical protein